MSPGLGFYLNEMPSESDFSLKSEAFNPANDPKTKLLTLFNHSESEALPRKPSVTVKASTFPLPHSTASVYVDASAYDSDFIHARLVFSQKHSSS